MHNAGGMGSLMIQRVQRLPNDSSNGDCLYYAL